MKSSENGTPLHSERTVKLAAHLYADSRAGNPDNDHDDDIDWFLDDVDQSKPSTWHFNWITRALISLRALQVIDAEEQENMMPLTQFARIGYLQEVNRRFLHPMGLAIALSKDNDTGAVRFLGIQDHSEDPEGMTFKSFSESDVERGQRIDALYKQALLARQKRLGYGVQPLSSDQTSQVIDSDISLGAE